LLELLGSKLKFLERSKPRNGEDLEEVENSMDFGGELWFTSESWKVSDTCHHLGWGQILTIIEAPCSFACRSLRMGSRMNEVGRKPFNALVYLHVRGQTRI